MSSRGKLKNIEKISLAALFILVSVAITEGYRIFSLPGALIPLSAVLVLILAATQRNYRRVRYEARELYRSLEALQTILPHLRLDRPLPPLGGHALSPNRARVLIDTILSSRPNHVVELGSGISTVLVAECLRQIGSGRITSFDHEELYATKTRAMLAAYGLTEFATVHYAPLENLQVADREHLWYATGQMPQHPDVDMLIVDGPPRKTQKLARFPAFPVLKSALTDRAVLLLDDAARKDEREIAKQWRSMGALEPAQFQHDENMLVMRFYREKDDSTV